jgi:hypothetical protein
MSSIEAWVKMKNLKSVEVKVSSDADSYELKEKKFNKEKNQYYATYKNEKLPSSTSVPTDTKDDRPIVFRFEINYDTVQPKQLEPGM